jgi:hypothetical protein
MIAFIFAKYDTGEGEARDMKKGERGPIPIKNVHPTLNPHKFAPLSK